MRYVWHSAVVVCRPRVTSGDPARYTASVRAEMAKVDSTLLMTDVAPMDTLVRRMEDLAHSLGAPGGEAAVSPTTKLAAMLKEGELRSLSALARELGIATLVESHDAAEFALADKIGAALIGINNRDLRTFATNIAITERLLTGYKGDAVIVTESGIDSADDIRRLDAAGAHAFLIGESLLRGGAPGAKLEELMHAL